MERLNDDLALNLFFGVDEVVEGLFDDIPDELPEDFPSFGDQPQDLLGDSVPDADAMPLQDAIDVQLDAELPSPPSLPADQHETLESSVDDAGSATTSTEGNRRISRKRKQVFNCKVANEEGTPTNNKKSKYLYEADPANGKDPMVKKIVKAKKSKIYRMKQVAKHDALYNRLRDFISEQEIKQLLKQAEQSVE